MIDDGKPSTREEQARCLAEFMKRQHGAFCPLLLERDVVELMLNANWRLRVGRPDHPMTVSGKIALLATAFSIGPVASTLRGAGTPDKPILECETPDESRLADLRFAVLISPVLSSRAFAIRRKTSAVFTLGEYGPLGIMTVSQRATVETAIEQRLIKDKVPRCTGDDGSVPATAPSFRARLSLKWRVFLRQGHLTLLNTAADRLRAKLLNGLVRQEVSLQVGVHVEATDRRLQFNGRPNKIRPVFPLANYPLKGRKRRLVESDHDSSRKSFRRGHSATVSAGVAHHQIAVRNIRFGHSELTLLWAAGVIMPVACLPRCAAVAGKHMMVRLFEHRLALLFAAGAAWAACGAPGAAGAAPLSTADFASLATRCAPAVPVGTLEAVAKTESGLDPWALRDNTTKVSETPPTLQAALSDVGQWISRGDSVDLGLMQINAANLDALGMTVHGALDPCASLAGGAAVLQAAYAGGKTSAEQQAALLMALSRYNTGSPFRGILDGYARRVIVNADAATAVPPAPAPQIVTRSDLNAPPTWNVWATAAYAQAHGAPWLIPLSPASSTPPQVQKSPPARPAPAAPTATVAAAVQARSSSQQPQRTP